MVRCLRALMQLLFVAAAGAARLHPESHAVLHVNESVEVASRGPTEATGSFEAVGNFSANHPKGDAQENRTTKSAGANALCKAAQAALRAECAVSLQGVPTCVAGTWTFEGEYDLTGKTLTSRCIDNPPVLLWGNPACASAKSGNNTIYTVTCQLCFAPTNSCFHLGAWAALVVAFGLLCWLCLCATAIFASSACSDRCCWQALVMQKDHFAFVQ